MVLTPVYVQTENEQALLNVLLIAFNIDNKLADHLKMSTHGTDFAFVSSDSVIAGTLPESPPPTCERGKSTRKSSAGSRCTVKTTFSLVQLCAILRETPSESSLSFARFPSPGNFSRAAAKRRRVLDCRYCCCARFDLSSCKTRIGARKELWIARPEKLPAQLRLSCAG